MAIAEWPGFGFFQVPAFAFLQQLSTQRHEGRKDATGRELRGHQKRQNGNVGCCGFVGLFDGELGGCMSFLKEVFMAKNVLNGKRVAILVTDGFEQVEMVKPRKALDKAGAKTVLISPVAPTSQTVRGWKETKWGSKFNVDVPLDQASIQDYDALLLPGGVLNPDKLRINAGAVEFVKSFFDANKPVAAICHGPQLLIEADVVRGRRMTSWPSLKTDLTNAGAQWVDESVVTDSNLVTSRKPDDIPQFNQAMVNEFAMAFAQPREEHTQELAETVPVL